MRKGKAAEDRRLDGRILTAKPAGAGACLHVGYNSHGNEECNKGGTAIAEKGQCQAHDRQYIQAHAHIEHGLDEQHTAAGDGNICTERGVAGASHIEAAQNDGGQEDQDGKTAQQTKLLAAG